MDLDRICSCYDTLYQSFYFFPPIFDSPKPPLKANQRKTIPSTPLSRSSFPRRASFVMAVENATAAEAQMEPIPILYIFDKHRNTPSEHKTSE